MLVRINPRINVTGGLVGCSGFLSVLCIFLGRKGLAWPFPRTIRAGVLTFPMVWQTVKEGDDNLVSLGLRLVKLPLPQRVRRRLIDRRCAF